MFLICAALVGRSKPEMWFCSWTRHQVHPLPSKHVVLEKRLLCNYQGPRFTTAKMNQKSWVGQLQNQCHLVYPTSYMHFSANALTPKRIHLSSKRNVSISSISSKGLDEPSKAFLGLLPQESRNDENGDTVPPQNLEIGEHRVVNKKPNVKFVKTVLFFPWKSLILEIFYVANQWKKEFAKEIFRTSDLTRQIPSA